MYLLLDSFITRVNMIYTGILQKKLQKVAVRQQQTSNNKDNGSDKKYCKYS